MNLRNASKEAKGMAYAVWGCFWFATMTAIVRHLSQTLPPLQVVFCRNAVAFLWMMPWIFQTGFQALSTSRFRLYFWRGLNGLIAMACWFTALSKIPIPTAISLSFTAPLFTTITAVVVLKEKVGIRRWVAVIIGFIGALVILRPGMDGFHYAYLLVLFASMLWAISNVIIKWLTATESSQAIVFYMTFVMTPLSLPFALLYWKAPTLHEWGWIVFMGISSNIAQFAISRAYALAEVSMIQPFDFTRLLFGSIIGYIAFGELIDGTTFVGAGIIIGSTLYIAYREARLRKMKNQC